VKRVILRFLLLWFFIAAGSSFASVGINHPLGNKWGDKDVVFSPKYEEAFVALYQITEEDVNSEKALYAFMKMKHIYKTREVDDKYEKNELQSEKLKNLLKDLYSAIDSPKTARDHFYKGLFSYYKHEAEMFKHFQHVIDTFPDTVYAKYSYFLLAENYDSSRNYNGTINILNNYLVKYGEDDTFIPDIYFRLSDNYRKLYAKTKDADIPIVDKYESLILSNAEKVLNRFPEKKAAVGSTLRNLSAYYESKGEIDKSLEYDLKVYDDPEHSMTSIYGALNSIVDKYIERKEYKEADNFLEDAKSRYFDNEKIREKYKEKKRTLKEISRFGFLWNDRSKESKRLYEKKKDEILKFREEYEKCWDADFNIIKPLP
jgi:hypothetical protein